LARLMPLYSIALIALVGLIGFVSCYSALLGSF